MAKATSFHQPGTGVSAAASVGQGDGTAGASVTGTQDQERQQQTGKPHLRVDALLQLEFLVSSYEPTFCTCIGCIEEFTGP